MPRGELHSDDIQLQQKPTIIIKAPGAKRSAGKRINKKGELELDSVAAKDREGEVVRPGAKLSKELLEDLKFMSEPVTIRLEPSSDKNAATMFPVWVNGKKAEIMINGRWRETPNGYLPVGMEITVKRSVLEVIARAKINTVETEIIENPGQDPENRIKTFTSPLSSFSVIADSSRGTEWLREVRRRYY